jgi:hypothetical protein
MSTDQQPVSSTASQESPPRAPPRAPRRKTAVSKTAAMLALLSRPKGAQLSDLEKITGWQPHSIRAALTGFRRQGHQVVRETNDRGITRYRITARAVQ